MQLKIDWDNIRFRNVQKERDQLLLEVEKLKKTVARVKSWYTRKNKPLK